MLGLRFSRLVHAAIAGGSLAMTGCVERLITEDLLALENSETDGTTGDETTDSDSAETTDGTTSTTNPTSPTSPTNPTAPTITDPTTPMTAGPMDGPPQLIDVRILAATQLQLVFSEAMGATSAVDPSMFRLSLAYSNYYSGYYEWGGTFYADLKQWTGYQYCYEYCWCQYYKYDYCQEYYCQDICNMQPGAPIVPIGITNDPVYGDRLLVNLDTPITTQVCDAVFQFQDGWVGSGMFLHYSNNAAPVLDTQGEQLAPIAEHWVLPPAKDYAYEQGYFQSMIPFIPIDCPF